MTKTHEEHLTRPFSRLADNLAEPRDAQTHSRAMVRCMSAWCCCVLMAVLAGGTGTAFERLRTPPPEPFEPLPALAGTGSVDEWERRRQELRQAWERIVGPMPQRVPLRTQVVSVEQFPDHHRLLLRYSLDATTRTEAYLLLPVGAIREASRRAAMVCLHPTTPATIRTAVGLEGREAIHYALHLVRRGYVTIAPRNYLWEVADQRWQQAAGRVIKRGWRTGMARMVFDAIRATDALLERPEVDPKRIGTIGHSLGGKEALYHAAFDGRIVAAISCEGGIGLKLSNWDAEWYLGKQIKSPQFTRDNHEVMALIAPRSLLVIGGESADGVQSWPFIEACLPVWRLYDAPERLGLLRHQHGHNFPPPGEERELVWQWLDEQMRR